MAAKFFFGTRKSDGVRVYLSKPTWDCGWYWSFGHLGNKDEHYHLSSYQTKEHVLKLVGGTVTVLREKRNKCLTDCLLEDYELNPCILGSIWKFCELALTAYSLKETAEVLGRGGSHMTTNPCRELIKNPEEVKRINEVVLPAVFSEIEKIFTEG